MKQKLGIFSQGSGHVYEYECECWKVLWISALPLWMCTYSYSFGCYGAWEKGFLATENEWIQKQKTNLEHVWCLNAIKSHQN